MTPTDATVDPDSGLALYTPLGCLKPVADDIWIVDDGVVWMSFPVLRVPFPTRMMIVRLRSDELMLISPTSPTDEVVAAVSALGEVAHLISPNAIHYVHIAAWKDLFPGATAWASPGVRERAASQGVSVSFDADLGDGPPAAWASEVDQLIFHGSPALSEVVFFHRASRTLILADLIENFELDRMHRPFWRTAARFAGTADPDGKTPLDLRLSFFGHRAQAREAACAMIAWEPERVLLAHGRWYDKDGVAELRRAFRWTGIER